MPSSGLSNSGAWNDAIGVERMRSHSIERTLCAACLRTRRYAAKVRKETEEIPSTATSHERWKQTRELRIAEKMIEICQGDGLHMGTILNGDLFDVVALEESLSDAAYAVCHRRNFFHGSASQLALTFTPGAATDIGLPVVEAKIGGSETPADADGNALSALGGSETRRAGVRLGRDCGRCELRSFRPNRASE